MAKTDWRFTDTVIPEDLNGIGEEINGLRTEMSTRFDHEATTPLTLQPGLQVVHAEKDARFKLGEIRGRTLVNLLGNVGDFEDLGSWRANGSDISLDPINYMYGSNSLKVSSNGYATWGGTSWIPIALDRTKYYVLVVEVKNKDASQGCVMLSISNNRNINGNPVSSMDKFKPSYIVISPEDMVDASTTSLHVLVRGSSGQSAYFDGLRIYEIAQAEYASLGSMTPEQVALTYPFAPRGIIGVENTYVINASENLLPPFYEWTMYEHGKILAPYEAIFIQTDQYWSRCWLDVIPHTDYTITFESPLGVGIGIFDVDVVEIHAYSSSGFTFNSGINNKIMVAVSGQVSGSITKPMLTVGTEPQPFQPQHKSMLAFQTELHANLKDGSEPDILFEQGGEYRKLAKWNKVVLDGSLNWLYGSGETGYKWVNLGLIGQIPDSGYVTKFDGSPLNRGLTIDGLPGSGPNRHVLRDNLLIITISNTDSGWGDDYTPLREEIKAYFNGWKMAHNNGVTPFTLAGVAANGHKVWIPALGFDGGNGTPTLLTSVSSAALAAGWGYYNLLYRLAKEVVEPVVTEGSLLLTEGYNIIEVGTGIVLREWNVPITSTTAVGINIIGSINAPLKNKADKILSIYKNGRNDRTWEVVTRTDGTAYGNQRAFTGISNYDPSAAYSVTYIKLDKSPIRPITGTLAANEKAQISELTLDVAEALQRVSVVEMKKAEKDASGWITPSTLLNGAVQGGNPVRYKKLSNALVLLDGIFIPSGINLTVFRLPENYRPKQYSRFPIICGTDTEFVSTYAAVQIDGNVVISSTVPLGWASLNGIIFLAEQ